MPAIMVPHPSKLCISSLILALSHFLEVLSFLGASHLAEPLREASQAAPHCA
jgi:hypothetical protein